jgi:hypothetical protein
MGKDATTAMNDAISSRAALTTQQQEVEAADAASIGLLQKELLDFLQQTYVNLPADFADRIATPLAAVCVGGSKGGRGGMRPERKRCWLNASAAASARAGTTST